jgi:integrase/recombinase XerD
MKDEALLGPWVRRFLLEHLVAERNLARNTQVSYRDTLALLLPFASKHGGQAIDRMTVEDLTPSLVRTFLNHLERDRKCSGTTRNQRLATIRSLARFIGMRSPAHVAWCAEIRATPFKKTAKTGIGYLRRPRWMHCWPNRIGARLSATEIMLCSCSCTTAVLVPTRRRR